MRYAEIELWNLYLDFDVAVHTIFVSKYWYLS